MGRFGKLLHRSERHGNAHAQTTNDNKAEGLPYQHRQAIKAKEFCNSFWGEEGYEILTEKTKMSTRMLEELKNWYKERALIEADYSKKLQKLSKSNLFQLLRFESDGLQLGLDSLREATAKSAHCHAELSGTFKTSLEAKTIEFINKREGARKNPQASIEKLHKRIIELKILQEKARKRFETDSIAVSGYAAQMHLVQGRELDKVSAKLDKAQGSIGITEKEYRVLTQNLEETTESWNLQWKSFCDLTQDLEEDRIDFVRSSLWDFANGLSTICMLEDEHSENLRKAVERCNTAQDVIKFIQQAGTGQELYAAPGYIDYPKGMHEDPKLIQRKYPRYELANFARNSCRDGQTFQLGTPSIISDLAMAIEAGSRTAGPPPTESHSKQAPEDPTLHQAKQHLKRGGNIAEVVATNALSLSNMQTTAATPPIQHRSVQLHPEPEVVDEHRPPIIYRPKHHDSFHGTGILVNHHPHPHHQSYQSHQPLHQPKLHLQYHQIPSSAYNRPLPPQPRSFEEVPT
ncbi:hypothetical protein PTTG_02862 [Puccinia triticina 1-1 BBBD Race 1]|uniref:F-BAR domain-containing protein n=1 Tax=Puccinia triticina (isolate 1-1 / race 1 (BBBD)) TaxID=630390 RepID=A0A180GN05_PUCT1|nr:hypothetical protein PTTG_02862 [Puccinia triticina 1-1 BBBD Race 1]WAR52460.1 hypothetical protein PtB15_1B902 [Puccinia triticina]